MSQEQVTSTVEDQDADGGGTQPVARTFTQAEVEELIRKRLEDRRSKYADYDDLKAAKEELDKIKLAQMSELEKAQAQVAQLQQERDDARKLAQDRLIRSAFVAEAAKAGAAHPEDAFALADQSGVAIDDATGQVSGVSAAIAALIEADRLVLASRPQAPALDGGAGGGQRAAGKVKLTPEQERIARNMGLSPEDYAASAAAIAAQKPTALN